MNLLRKRIEREIEERLEQIRTVRVLEVHALGAKDTESLLKFMHMGKIVEDIIKENIELRGKYLRLEAKLTFLADKIVAEKWRELLELSRNVMEGDYED